jgi:hypothetical protein
MTDDRRKDPRVPVRLEAEVKFTSWLVYSVLYAVNISNGGLNLEMRNEPQLGDALEIKLTQPDGTILRLNAVVKHLNRCARHNAAGRFRCGWFTIAMTAVMRIALVEHSRLNVQTQRLGAPGPRVAMTKPIDTPTFVAGGV